MKDTVMDLKKVIYPKEEVDNYIANLKFALSNKQTSIIFEKKRVADVYKDEKNTNRFTVDNLFPNQDERKVLRRELQKLKVEEYIHTIDDADAPGLKKLWVFGRKYDKDVYIKIRVELFENYVLVRSFHYAEWKYNDASFPYRKER